MWKHLTVDDLKKILSDDEVEKINEIAFYLKRSTI